MESNVKKKVIEEKSKKLELEINIKYNYNYYIDCGVNTGKK